MRLQYKLVVLCRSAGVGIDGDRPSLSRVAASID